MKQKNFMIISDS